MATIMLYCTECRGVMPYKKVGCEYVHSTNSHTFKEDAGLISIGGREAQIRGAKLGQALADCVIRMVR